MAEYQWWGLRSSDGHAYSFIHKWSLHSFSLLRVSVGSHGESAPLSANGFFALQESMGLEDGGIDQPIYTLLGYQTFLLEGLTFLVFMLFLVRRLIGAPSVGVLSYDLVW